jgi:hypothetical protein
VSQLPLCAVCREPIYPVQKTRVNDAGHKVHRNCVRQAYQTVICLNDFPEEILAPGTTDERADARCALLKERYLQANSGVRPLMIRFHHHRVPVRTV